MSDYPVPPQVAIKYRLQHPTHSFSSFRDSISSHTMIGHLESDSPIRRAMAQGYVLLENFKKDPEFMRLYELDTDARKLYSRIISLTNYVEYDLKTNPEATRKTVDLITETNGRIEDLKYEYRALQEQILQLGANYPQFKAFNKSI